jgi:hypothetical protein
MNDIIRMGCSSVSVWGDMTEEGSPITGRNNDWHKIAAMIENQLVIVRIPPEGSGKLGFVSVAWPGVIGCITGMNEKGIVLTSHDSRGLPSSVRNGIYPYMMTFRTIIESTSPGTAVQDVEEILNGRITGIGKNLMITIPTGSDGPCAIVFELDGNRETDHGYTKCFPEASHSYMICTNHFRKRKEPDGDHWRFELLNNRLEMTARNNSEKRITVENVWDMLEEVVLPGLRTHHSVVFEPDDKIMHIAIAEPDKDAPFCKKVQFNISELLKDRF